MNRYRVKRIDLNRIKTIDEYWNAVNQASIRHCVGLSELREYCGGRLHSHGRYYVGVNGNFEYVAEKI